MVTAQCNGYKKWHHPHRYWFLMNLTFTTLFGLLTGLDFVLQKWWWHYGTNEARLPLRHRNRSGHGCPQSQSQGNSNNWNSCGNNTAKEKEPLMCQSALSCVSSYHRDLRWFKITNLSTRSASNKTCLLGSTPSCFQGFEVQSGILR